MNLLFSESWNAVVLFLFATGAVVLQVIGWRMQKEVRTRLPDDSRGKSWLLSRFGRSWRMYAQHRRLFPNSKLRSVGDIIAVIWFPFGVIGTMKILDAADAWVEHIFRR